MEEAGHTAGSVGRIEELFHRVECGAKAELPAEGCQRVPGRCEVGRVQVADAQRFELVRDRFGRLIGRNAQRLKHVGWRDAALGGHVGRTMKHDGLSGRRHDQRNGRGELGRACLAVVGYAQIQQIRNAGTDLPAEGPGRLDETLDFVGRFPLDALCDEKRTDLSGRGLAVKHQAHGLVGFLARQIALELLAAPDGLHVGDERLHGYPMTRFSTQTPCALISSVRRTWSVPSVSR